MITVAVPISQVSFMRRNWRGLLGSAVCVLFLALGGLAYQRHQKHGSTLVINPTQPAVSASALAPLVRGLSEPRPDGARRLTAGVGQASYQNACFSPDSQQLVYTRWRDAYNTGPADVIVRDLQTGNERRLTGDGDAANVNVPFGCWRGDRIVFASDRGGGPDEIWSIRADGSNPQQITHHTDQLAYIEPVYSPDGSRIAFEADRKGDSDDQQFGETFTINSDGTNARQITDSPTSDDRLPSWSNDGKLLFQRRTLTKNTWSDWDVFVTEQTAAGNWTEARDVTGQSAGEDTDPSWSPDGRSVISSSDFGKLVHPNIFAFSLTGGEPVQLTTSPDREDGAPSISPNGQWLVFESHRTSNENSPSDIWFKKLSP